jgi:hypothetical protein
VDGDGAIRVGCGGEVVDADGVAVVGHEVLVRLQSEIDQNPSTGTSAGTVSWYSPTGRLGFTLT